MLYCTASRTLSQSFFPAKTVDVSRLDLRVGKILSAKRHPDADTLFVEESKKDCALQSIITNWFISVGVA